MIENFKPQTKKECYLAAISGNYDGELPTPQTRTQLLLKEIALKSNEEPEPLDLVGKSYIGENGGKKGEIFNYYQQNKATGDYSHAEGWGTTASGNYSHAEGNNTTASKDYSHAEGRGTTASGTYSHAEGDGTTAYGVSSHAEGGGTTASGIYSHAEGHYTIAASEHQHVQGKYNIKDDTGKYAFIIGNGTSENTRSNAFAIDWNGNIYVNNSETGVNVSDLLTRVVTLESEVAALKAGSV